MAAVKKMGNVRRLYVEISGSDEVLAFETENTLEVQNPVIDATTKDGVDSLDGLPTWTVTASANWNETTGELCQKLLDLISDEDGSKQVTVYVGEMGARKKGKARITSFSNSNPLNGVSTITCAFQGVGELTTDATT